MPHDNEQPDLLDGITNDTAAAIAAGTLIGEPHALDDEGRFFQTLVPAGATTKLFDLQAEEDKLAYWPRRKTGTVYVQDGDSFVAYLDKHGEAATEVYADPSKQKLVAVINANSARDGEEEGRAGHRDHRVALDLVRTKPWQTWRDLDGKVMGQEQFAHHIESNSIDVVDPDGATMLEIAQSLMATTSSEFKSAHRLADGNVQFRYEEQTSARAGETGDLEIPLVFLLSIAPFEGDDPVEVTARFRYRTGGGQPLRLFYELLRPEEVEYAAFQRRVAGVREAIPHPVFLGRPE